MQTYETKILNPNKQMSADFYLAANFYDKLKASDLMLDSAMKDPNARYAPTDFLSKFLDPEKAEIPNIDFSKPESWQWSTK